MFCAATYAFRHKFGVKMTLQNFLDSQYAKFNASEFLQMHPDPLIVVTQNKDFKPFDEMALICALYAYGNASLIVKNLQNMPFFLLTESITKIDSILTESFPYYRFQSREDCKNCFKIFAILIQNGGIKSIFLNEYKKNNSVIQGIRALQDEAQKIISKYKMHSKGLEFLFGNPKNTTSPLKRYNMFLRWMVRHDSLDFGLWSEVNASDLLLPLDTHTFRIAKDLRLCRLKSYNLKAAQEITQNLKAFDPLDPVKYDFALYRIGQLKLDFSHVRI